MCSGEKKGQNPLLVETHQNVWNVMISQIKENHWILPCLVSVSLIPVFYNTSTYVSTYIYRLKYNVHIQIKSS